LQFYIREAWLLDARKFEEWLDLFTDDASTSCRAARTPRAGKRTAS
jgi:3-phenylpropionate/cinnamic acid dioxygenase small subunit